MDIPVTRAAEGLDRRAFTIADMERMVEIGVIGPDERLELVGGEIVPMSPKGSRHEVIKSALTLQWGRICPPGYAFAQEPGLRLDARIYLEPDFVVFENSVDFPSLSGGEVLLAIEVSDSSLSYDLGRKSRLYAGLGVHELWVVDTRHSIVHRHRDPAPGGYARIDRLGAADKLAPALAPAEFGFSLDEISKMPRRR
jgi:Uma2 family endonuclease